MINSDLLNIPISQVPIEFYNANNAEKIGLYILRNGINVPFGSETPWVIFNTGSYARIQIAWKLYGWETSYNIYVRFFITLNDGIWSDWYKITTQELS